MGRYDHLLYPPGAFGPTLQEWLDHKVSANALYRLVNTKLTPIGCVIRQTGIMGRFPFGPFAYARLDERMKSHPEWNEALEKNPGVDPMNTTPNQPHIECESLPSLKAIANIR